MSGDDVALFAWRVYRITNEFRDRPETGEGDQQWTVNMPGTTDLLTATVGAIPAHVQQSFRDYRAMGAYVLNTMFGNTYADKSVDERENLIASLEAEVDVTDLNLDDGLFLTLELRRPRTVESNDTRHFLWVQDPGGLDLAVMRGFAAEAEPLLDASMAWLLPTLSPRLGLGAQIVPGHRVFLAAPGKAAICLPEITGSARAHVVGQGWQELPWGAMRSALETYASRSKSLTGPLAVPARWLSLGRGEEDSLRKFLFAFVGLEVLANKHASRSRKALVTTLGKEAAGLPFEELMWPSMPDENAPDRNLVFKFAAMAAVVSRVSAAEDVAQFRRLAKARNSLAHGEITDLDNLPGIEALTLLERYVALVASFLSDETQPPAPPESGSVGP
jgi:hypothetical protein